MKHIISFAFSLLLISGTLQASVITDPIYGYENFNLGGSRKGLTIVPNPATGDVQILFVSGRTSQGTIKVYDEKGAVVLTSEVSLLTGKNKINVDGFKQLAEGKYSIRLVTMNHQFTGSFLLWK